MAERKIYKKKGEGDPVVEAPTTQQSDKEDSKTHNKERTEHREHNKGGYGRGQKDATSRGRGGYRQEQR